MARVLVVDDDENIREFVSLALMGEGHEVDVAANGAVALDVVQTASPDVILLDMRMPVTSGAEAIRILRKRDGTPPVLVLTTYDDTETVHEAVTAGAAGFALKDSSAEDLHRAVRELAYRVQDSDPGFSADLYAAAARHEAERD